MQAGRLGALRAGVRAQLVSLRAFQPSFAPWGRPSSTWQRPNAAPRASGTGFGVLHAAQLLPQLVVSPATIDVQQLPAFEEWHRHPELLLGCAPPSAGVVAAATSLPSSPRQSVVASRQHVVASRQHAVKWPGEKRCGLNKLPLTLQV